MSTTAIYLVRHAQIAENLPRPDGLLLYGAFPEAPLDEMGRRQAAALAARLADVSLAVAYSSPYRRAEETAQAIVAGQAGSTPDPALRLDSRWQERDFGQLEALTVAQIAEVCPPGPEVLYASEDGHPGGAESLLEVRARARQAFDELCERHQGQSVLVASHKTTLRVLICDLLKLPLTTYKRIGQENAALNVVTIESDSSAPEGRHVRVVLTNDVCHLGEVGDVPGRGARGEPQG
ncbi:MAG: histidine phosphatase family protein [Armatimonadota bacterium]